MSAPARSEVYMLAASIAAGECGNDSQAADAIVALYAPLVAELEASRPLARAALAWVEGRGPGWAIHDLVRVMPDASKARLRAGA